MGWLLGIAGLVAVFVIMIYNRLVRFREMAEEAFSGMDVQLKRRHDLIPRLVEAVRGYIDYEAQVLVDVTAGRAQAKAAADRQTQARLENGITQGLKTLFAVVENYPDLQASKNFLDLHAALVQVEDDIQLARRYYNGTVRQFNVLIQSFPANLIAGMFGFAQKDFFEITTMTERQAPTVDMPSTDRKEP